MVVYFMLISINADDIDHSTTLLLYTYYYHVFIFVKINVNIGISHIWQDQWNHEIGAVTNLDKAVYGQVIWYPGAGYVFYIIKYICQRFP